MEGKENEGLENRYKKIAKLEWLTAAVLTLIFVIGSIFSFVNYRPAKGQLTLENYGDVLSIEGYCVSIIGGNAYCNVYVRIADRKYEIRDFSAKLTVGASACAETKTISFSGGVSQKNSVRQECVFSVTSDAALSSDIIFKISVLNIEGEYVHV